MAAIPSDTAITATRDELNPLSLANQPAVSSVAAQTVDAGAANASTVGTVRSVSGSSNASSTEAKSRRLEAQSFSSISSSTTVDPSAMARMVTDASGVVNRASDSAGASATTAATTDSRDTFAALDTAGAGEKATWIHASAQQAEAGYQDPSLGWVSVRANASGGGVHAELATASTDAAQALGGHLAGLNAYLADHHAAVESLTITAPNSGSSGFSSDQGAGQGMQQGAGQQNSGAESGFQSGAYTSSASTSSVTSSGASPAVWEGNAQPAGLASGHISVMA